MHGNNGSYLTVTRLLLENNVAPSLACNQETKFVAKNFKAFFTRNLLKQRQVFEPQKSSTQVS